MPTWGLVFLELDNIILNNYWRKFYTYKEIGWDENSIKAYLSDKKNMLQIASFNTPTVTFSASSRRNRFYAIYNRLDMLTQDVAWEGAVEGLKKLSQMYKIYILSSREEPLKDKTLEVMKNLGFDLNEIEIIFKKPHEQLFKFRVDALKKIKEDFPTGVGVCLQPNEKDSVERIGYTPVAFTSIKNTEDFMGKISVICYDWAQLLSALGIKNK